MSTFVIIGASSGIGKQLAQQLSFLGHSVYATYNSHETPNENSIQYFHCNTAEVAPDFSFIPSQIDGLVYCPGAIDLKPFNRIKPDDFIADYNLQVLGAIKSIQAALPSLKSSAKGSIVLFSTVAVQTGMGFHSLVASSKGAIEGLTRALAAEFAPNIRVNCIAPSLTDTPLASRLLNTEDKRLANAQRHPLKAIGTSTDIAELAEFILSDKSQWMTGQILHLDGGMSSIR